MANLTLLDKNRNILNFTKRANQPGSNIKINGVFYGLDDEKLKSIEDLLNEIESLYQKLGKGTKNRIYIPTLRTSHSIFEGNSENGFKKISKDIFQQTILKNYSILLTNVEIFTGLTLYNEIVNARNNIKTIRDRFEKFEKFISDNFFQKKKIDIVAKFDIDSKNEGLNDGEIINIYIDGESKDLYELGDGIQAIIILLYKIYMAEKDSIIFIDEPEINLHPGMQRLFLEQITNNDFIKKKNLTFFISTHSNHFLDLTIDKENISIFLFNKIVSDNEDARFVVKNVNHGDNSALQYLGVTNSSVFLANCSIWVEGISDRNYLKAFLKAYCKAENKVYPKEDIEFAFIEYAGSNIDHYNFDKVELEKKINAFSINNKILLISDFDGEYKEEKHNFYKLIDKHNENFTYLTTKDYKEIENVLPFIVWKNLLIYFCNKNKMKNDELRNDVQNRISEALKRRKENNYKGHLLKSLQGTVPEINKIWTGNSAPKTLLNKAEVSYRVLEMVEKGELNWKDFKTNPVIIKFTEHIYKFIQNSNFKN
jgi:predicted ATP-dependent endonuclease of OLD family